MDRFKAAIFDFGGVITTSPVAGIRAYCERMGMPHDALRPLLILEDGAWSRFEKSALTREEFIRAFEAEAAEHGLSLDGAHFLSGFVEGITVRPDMVAAVRGLHRHMKTGCITNNMRAEGPRRLAEMDVLFDVVVESSKEGMRKPDPRIYQIACDRLGVRPDQSVFLDDFGVNLKAARALGMATIRVDDTPSWYDELLQLGIPEDWLREE